VVDAEVLRRRIDALRGYVARLREFAGVEPATFVAEPRQHDLAERYLHLAAEAAIDTANHVIADAGWEAPDTYRSSFEILARHGLVDAELSRRLQGWAGLRNILVHAYLDIDHHLTLEAIRNDLDDLEALASIAAELL
jgi:uncharacterized protein YutE (UPF0331/DUF86 family)